jgi:hypothetical protein
MNIIVADARGLLLNAESSDSRTHALGGAQLARDRDRDSDLGGDAGSGKLRRARLRHIQYVAAYLRNVGGAC